MSQGGAAQTASGGGGSIVQTLTGNSGGPVSPSGGNINVIGNTSTGIDVVGTPGLNTLTIINTLTITGDTGGPISPSFSNWNLFANPVSGSSVSISGLASTLELNVTDSNSNTIVGLNAGNPTITGLQNTGLGRNVLKSVTSSGDNTALGFNALTNLSGGTGFNVGIGSQAGFGISTGDINIAIGLLAMGQGPCSGAGNVCLGLQAGYSITTANGNVAIGARTLSLATSSSTNSAYGDDALGTLISGSGDNTGIGNSALLGLITGTNNSALGTNSGSRYSGSESNNIVIGNQGIAGDNNTIKIGTSVTHTTCFVQGIAGVSVSSPNFVTINTSTGQLGSVSMSGGGLVWNDVTGATQTIASGNGYLADRAGGVAFTLPASATLGDVFRIVGVQGSWTVAQAANQQIKFGNQNTTVGITGSLASTNAGDCLECVATNTSASTVWRVMSSIGNITYA